MTNASIAQIHHLLKQGQPLASLIPEGADLAWWERALKSYAAKLNSPKKRQPKKRSRSRSNRSQTFRNRAVLASMSLSSSEKQGRKRAKATAELVDRANTRSILVTQGNNTSILEV